MQSQHFCKPPLCMQGKEDKPGRRLQRDILILIAGVISWRWVIIISVDIIACVGILGVKSRLAKIRDAMYDSPNLKFPCTMLRKWRQSQPGLLWLSPPSYTPFPVVKYMVHKILSQLFSSVWFSAAKLTHLFMPLSQPFITRTFSLCTRKSPYWWIRNCPLPPSLPKPWRPRLPLSLCDSRCFTAAIQHLLSGAAHSSKHTVCTSQNFLDFIL